MKRGVFLVTSRTKKIKKTPTGGPIAEISYIYLLEVKRRGWAPYNVVTPKSGWLHIRINVTWMGYKEYNRDIKKFLQISLE